jgi:hypothetical protein
MQTSQPIIIVYAFPSGPNGNEWSTAVSAADHDHLVSTQAEARLIEEAVETDRKYGVELDASRTILQNNTLLLQRVTTAEVVLTKLPQLLTAAEGALAELLTKPPETSDRIRIIDKLRTALETLRSVPPVTVGADSEHYAQVKAVYDYLLKSPLPLDGDEASAQE